MTKDEIKKLVMLAVANYPPYHKNDNSPIVYSWQNLLSDLDYLSAEKGLLKVQSTVKYFPSAAEIRSAAKEFQQGYHRLPSAEEAWAEVVRQLDFYTKPSWSHPYIQEAVQRVGFANLCRSEKIAIERAHFLRFYDSIVDQAKNDQINGEVHRLAAQLSERLAMNATTTMKELN